MSAAAAEPPHMAMSAGARAERTHSLPLSGGCPSLSINAVEGCGGPRRLVLTGHALLIGKLTFRNEAQGPSHSD